MAANSEPKIAKDGKQLNLEGNLFIVVNSEGKVMRTRGYGGSGDSWVDTLTTARIYVKLSHARTQAGFWEKSGPRPDIYMLTSKGWQLLDESDFIEKRRARITKKAKKQLKKLL